MSQPISACMISKAVFGTPDDRQALLKAMKYNMECGHHMMIGCAHTPICKRPSEEQIDQLNKEITEFCKPK